jgi:hypothetical protein
VAAVFADEGDDIVDCETGEGVGGGVLGYGEERCRTRTWCARNVLKGLEIR